MPDIVGRKYEICGGPAGLFSLPDAIKRMNAEGGNGILVHGSERPIVVVRGAQKTSIVDFVGASFEEAATARALLPPPPTEPVILRIRMRRSTLDLIRRAATTADVGIVSINEDKSMSAFCLDAILSKLEKQRQVPKGVCLSRRRYHRLVTVRLRRCAIALFQTWTRRAR